MSNTYFSFKQFTVNHNLCAMKVGTDGVLLGAWATCTDSTKILDVGTGSGLISLMLAQRSKAIIDSIDIDKDAYIQAKINFEQSIFRERLNSYHIDFLNYHPEDKYNLIVSNPPYFSNSLHSPEESRTVARHNKELDLVSFIKKAKSLLSPQGIISIILPYDTFDTIQSICKENNLFLSRKTTVKPTEDKPAKRVLLEYSDIYQEVKEEEFYIEKSRHHYSNEFITLTKDFYLKM